MKDFFKIALILVGGVALSCAPLLPAHPTTQRMLAIIAKKKTAGGGQTPTWIQDDGSTFDPFNAARSVTFGSTTTSGSRIIAIYYGTDTFTSLTVTDNNSNTYTTHVDGSTSRIAIASANNGSAKASHQVTFTVSPSNANLGNIIVLEYSGVKSTGAFDQGAQASSFTANQSVTTGATDTDVELLIGTYHSGTAPTGPGSGFTARHAQGNLHTEDKNSTSAGAQTINWVNPASSVQISGATFRQAP